MAIPHGILNQASEKNHRIDPNVRRAAQERILLYLSALGMPPEESLASALEALERAALTDFSSNGDAGMEPVAAAVKSLKIVLRSRGRLLPGDEPDFSAHLWRQALRWNSSGVAPSPFRVQGKSLRSMAMPPMKRSSMPAAQLDFSPWRLLIRAWRRLIGKRMDAVFSSGT